MPRDSRRQEALERSCARAALVTCSSARVCKITSVATRARVHGQVRPGVARASWCEDFVYRAGFAVGERLRRELLLYCCETNYSNGKRLTRFSRPTVLFVRWRQHTNTIRPHSALGYRPPAPPGVAGPLEGKLLTKKLASFMGAGQLYAICSQGWLLWMAPADTCDFKLR